MKLFDDYEAVKFPEENAILITHGGFLYYYYQPRYEHWERHKNAGNDYLTVSNYPDVSREELAEAMGGKFPEKITDILRLLYPKQLYIVDMLQLMKEDYPDYMSDNIIYHAVHAFLLESVICYKSYLRLRELLDHALKLQQDNELVLSRVADLSFEMIGRDIFKREIGIVDGHDSTSYFWFMPVRVLDYSNTYEVDNVAEMRSAEISVEEDDVAQYLTPFLYKYFDEDLKANKCRVHDRWTDDDGNEQIDYITGFEWYLTENFYSYDAIEQMLADMKDTMEALASGRENGYTAELKIKRGTETHKLIYAKGLTDEQIKEYNDNRPTVDDTEADLVIDFYRRFIYRMEYMMKVGREKGFDLICIMGP